MIEVFYPANVAPVKEPVDRTPSKKQVAQLEKMLKAIEVATPVEEVIRMINAEMPNVFSSSEKKFHIQRVYAELHPVKEVIVEPELKVLVK